MQSQNIKRKAMNAISMNNLWNYLQGLSLSASNQRWLAERLLENSTKESAVVGMQKKKLVFPKIEKEFEVSQEVLDMVCGTLPEDFDFDKEMEIMWEEMVQ